MTKTNRAAAKPRGTRLRKNISLEYRLDMADRALRHLREAVKRIAPEAPARNPVNPRHAGDVVRGMRERARKTRAEVAASAGVSTAVITRIEGRGTVPSSLPLVSKIANALGVPSHIFIRRIFDAEGKWKTDNGDMSGIPKFRCTACGDTVPSLSGDKSRTKSYCEKTGRDAVLIRIPG